MTDWAQHFGDTDTDLTAHRIVLIEAIGDLKTKLTAFILSLQDAQAQGKPALVYDEDDGKEYKGKHAWKRAIEIFGQIEYEDGQPPQDSVTLPGVLGVTPEVLFCGAQLNEAKNHFKKSYMAVNEHVANRDGKQITQARRLPAAKETLTGIGHARIHLKQTYRQVVLIEDRPDRIGFSWTKTRKVSKISVNQAKRLADNHGDSPIVEDAKAKLETINPHEVLAFVQEPQQPHLRSNLAYRNREGLGKRKTLQKLASLPLLVICPEGRLLPPINPYRKQDKKPTRKGRRSDVRIEEAPFVPLIHVHRYLPEYREYKE